MRDIRRICARDVIDDCNPDRLIAILDQAYMKGFRDGYARGRQAKERHR